MVSFLFRQRSIPRSSRRRSPEAPDRARQFRNTRSGKPWSRGESPAIPAQAGSATTGLSRRRSRVRVPSLPSLEVPANRPVRLLLKRTERLRHGPHMAQTAVRRVRRSTRRGGSSSESSGGQRRQEATVPELRLAVGEPDLEIGYVETAPRSASARVLLPGLGGQPLPLLDPSQSEQAAR
jgi:hypothetical protein